MSRESLPASNSLQEELEARASEAIFPALTKLDGQRRHEKGGKLLRISSAHREELVRVLSPDLSRH